MAPQHIEHYTHPDAVDDLHIMRYRFAGQFVRGKSVLDAACGIGYGTRILRDAGATSCLGVDRDAEVIETARRHYATDGVTFEQADVFDAAKGSFDVVVSVETIEHLDRGDSWPAQVASALAPDGVAVFSSPLRCGGSVKDEPANPFHVREWDTREFRELLERSFGDVELRFQGFVAPEVGGPRLLRPVRRGLLLRSEATRSPRPVQDLDEWFEAYGCRPAYMMAVASLPQQAV